MSGLRVPGVLGTTATVPMRPGTGCRAGHAAASGEDLLAPLRLRPGQRGDAVVRLQRALNRALGADPPLREDGHFGSRTEAALRRFQAMAGLPIDGVADRFTWQALRRRVSAERVQGSLYLRAADAPWMEVAAGEIGESEVRGRCRHNERIVEYQGATTLRSLDDETPWCSSFVNWCLQQVGIVGTRSALAASWLNWATGVPCDARTGAICVIYNERAVNTGLSRTGNHVGFLVAATARRYLLLGGNQSDQVRVSSFPTLSWRLRGYRWPADAA
jgi:uncharacterized protein (TIGR02594 family)